MVAKLPGPAKVDGFVGIVIVARDLPDLLRLTVLHDAFEGTLGELAEF